MDKKIKPVLIMALAWVLIASPAYAIDPDSQTWFNSMTDYIATVGKSETDKKQIKRMRKKMRREYREQKARIHKKEQTQKNIKKQQSEIKDKYNTGNTKIGL